MKNVATTKFVVSIFTFSWLCWAIAVFSGQPSTAFPNVIFYMLGGSGPSIVALFFLFRYVDQEARRDFWRRLIDVRRIQPVWWILCLLAIPVLMLLAVALDVLLGGTFSAGSMLQMVMAQPAAIPMYILMMLVGGALSEELGWRGIVLGSFQQKWTPPGATLILALIWWAFHLPLFFLRGTAHYDWGFFTPMFWAFLLNVIPLAALFTLAYNHNRQSILTAVLIHFSYNFMLGLLVPISVRAYVFVAIFLALLVAALVRSYGWMEKRAKNPVLHGLLVESKL